ncbi:ABC transporter permease [Microbulbifer thermotolerans]|uniref:ABC transporter permease n=1 Tax=Microbulbifer thermotolerans TaxID=252514 RepID=UPI0022495A5C|nr:FtsX-like permease family protein [Microbulbifer thermotolerans]MCX2784262.1 ABC transporter permease [Microbulbifer thermotolerans]MCX2794339.1 ABC transporter permease [Microbulbifer thermotolerans]MCX2841709.1 ABC transporter permease [Microbulbifer thermotolerans]
MLEIKPILSALWRNKIAALLIALQLALTLAIVSNASVIISDRQEKTARPTGIAVEDIITVNFQPVSQNYDMQTAVAADLDLIRTIPGVVEATHSNHFPLSGSGSASAYYNQPSQETGGEVANYYQVGAEFIQAMGMKLIAGRNFDPSDIQVADLTENRESSVVIVTKQFAEKLFPEGDALGKYIYGDRSSHPIEIIGIVERNLGGWVNWSKAGNAVFFPEMLIAEGNLFMRYLVRTEPGQRDSVFNQLEEKLSQRDPHRVIEMDTIENFLHKSYSRDNTMIKVLSVVIGLLTFIIALGIVGLTTFWINQRRKQIGVRRALGATRAAIGRYFLLENGMIASAGIALGMAAAQIANRMMVESYGQPQLPLPTMLSCALILLIVSLTAALVPALRAANISPATATRNV